MTIFNLGIILTIALGAILGSLSGYYTILVCTQKLHYPVFYGTLLVNAIGSMMIGFLAVYFQQGDLLVNSWTKFSVIGFLGSYTTFSSYILDTVNLYQANHSKLALVYFVTSPILGFALVEIGIFIFHLLPQSWV